MKRFSIASLALASLLAAAPAAMADDFNFTFTSQSTTGVVPDIYAYGTLTGSQIGSTGVWDITSGDIYLASDTLAVTGSGTLAASGWEETDNELTPGATGMTPYIDTGGLLFSIDGLYVNLYSDAEFAGAGTFSYTIFEQVGAPPDIGVDALLLPTGGTDTGYSNEFALTSGTATPEPPSVLLLASGMLALALLAFRTRRAGAEQNL
jgi:hypothetical protein